MSDKVTVEKMDAGKKNSPITDSASDESTVLLDNVPSTCIWNDQEYPEGQIVECDGKTYECNYGQWVKKN